MNPRFFAALFLAALIGGCTNGYYMSGPGYTIRTPNVRLVTDGGETRGSWSARLGNMDGRMDENTQFFYSVTIEDGSSGASVSAMTSVRSMIMCS